MDSSWEALTAHVRRLSTLGSVMGTLGWDEQTMLPPKGAPLRGRQQALLAGISHEWTVDPAVETWLAALEGATDPVRVAARRNVAREYQRERKVPSELVDQLAIARSEGFASWIEAKKASDFSIFAPKLERLLDLSRRRAEAIDPDRHPYDVTLEEFDPGTEVEGLRAMFKRLRTGLVELIEAIGEAEPLAPLGVEVPEPVQQVLHRRVAEALGYDFEGGRLDHAEHPFTSGMGPGDVRITTHIDPHDLLNGLGSTIHEAGHALYEQGLPHQHAGTTVNRAASYGLHESQSRFWENFIGRSEPFCGWLEQQVSSCFEGSPITAADLFRASNRVERGLIRVAADEVTYNLHVIVRFEIEVALFEGRLSVAELPAAWNARYEEYLGVTPPDDARGVLQDVHWSSAAFGYFPSYTLGNLYAASLGATLEARSPTLWSDVGAGRFGDVLAFLRENVHQRGHIDDAPKILAAAVGERDHVEDLLAYLWGRHGKLYGVERPD